MKEYAFGIDLGGTTAKIGLFKTTGELLEKWEVPTDTSNACLLYTSLLHLHQTRPSRGTVDTSIINPCREFFTISYC